jgi:DNA-binding MarR family transcriptional regulator
MHFILWDQKMASDYVEVISLVGQLHRNFLELVKLELDKLGLYDINNVQALMLFNLGAAEIPVGELMSRGWYLGSNVSYNVRKMVENGYLKQERSIHDRRSLQVGLTTKGHNLRERLSDMHTRHLEILTQSGATEADLKYSAEVLNQLDRFLTLASNIASQERLRA